MQMLMLYSLSLSITLHRLSYSASMSVCSRKLQPFESQAEAAAKFKFNVEYIFCLFWLSKTERPVWPSFLIKVAQTFGNFGQVFLQKQLKHLATLVMGIFWKNHYKICCVYFVILLILPSYHIILFLKWHNHSSRLSLLFKATYLVKCIKPPVILSFWGIFVTCLEESHFCHSV